MPKEPDSGNGNRAVEIIIPVFNEAEVIEPFFRQLRAVIDKLPHHFTLRYVDDGSTDGTGERLSVLAGSDKRVEVLHLSRNFGHQAALTAGLDASTADVVITMDGDGQHPPALVPQMLELFEGGYDVVLTQREDAGIGPFKHWTSAAFYGLLNAVAATKLVPGAADFRLLSRQVVEALRDMREHHRFLRGMVSWAGYRTVILPYRPQGRLAGRSKYSLRKMLGLAMDATFSFSLVPLYLGVALGFFFLVLATAEVVYVGHLWLSGQRQSLEPGWSSLMFMLLIVGGTLSTTLGIIGLYVGYIFQEVKRRPSYLLRNVKRPQPTPEPTSRSPKRGAEPPE